MTRRKTGEHPIGGASRFRARQGPAAGDDFADDEAGLFRRLMDDAKRLETDRAPPQQRRAPPRATFARRDRREVLRESLEGGVEGREADAGEHLHFRHPSVSRATMRRLARGGFSRQAEIDLHGLTATEAREELARFIADCVHRDLTCIRIVHGKGLRSGHSGPVLKRLVDQWLRRSHPVLAFVTARPPDGGSGAVYALLRRAR